MGAENLVRFNHLPHFIRNKRESKNKLWSLVSYTKQQNEVINLFLTLTLDGRGFRLSFVCVLNPKYVSV